MTNNELETVERLLKELYGDGVMLQYDKSEIVIRLLDYSSISLEGFVFRLTNLLTKSHGYSIDYKKVNLFKAPSNKKILLVEDEVVTINIYNNTIYKYVVDTILKTLSEISKDIAFKPEQKYVDFTTTKISDIKAEGYTGIDYELAELVVSLNKKGWVTTHCCAGHEEHSPKFMTYINFKFDISKLSKLIEFRESFISKELIDNVGIKVDTFTKMKKDSMSIYMAGNSLQERDKNIELLYNYFYNI